jgi:hypothetical protein
MVHSSDLQLSIPLGGRVLVSHCAMSEALTGAVCLVSLFRQVVTPVQALTRSFIAGLVEGYSVIRVYNLLIFRGIEILSLPTPTPVTSFGGLMRPDYGFRAFTACLPAQAYMDKGQGIKRGTPAQMALSITPQQPQDRSSQ